MVSSKQQISRADNGEIKLCRFVTFFAFPPQLYLRLVKSHLELGNGQKARIALVVSRQSVPESAQSEWQTLFQKAEKLAKEQNNGTNKKGDDRSPKSNGVAEDKLQVRKLKRKK